MNERGSGWVLFASIALGIAGIMRIFDAIWAFSYHGALPDHFQGAVFGQDLTAYAWIYLVEGIVLLVSAGGVLAGLQVSRWIGIVAGALVSISAIWLMPFFPVWSLVYVVLGILVIYALAAYGDEPVLS
jgi:hypothetical protein